MPETDPRSDTPAPAAARLLACLRARRTDLLIYQHYRRSRPQADFANLLDTLIDDVQDSIAALSSLLRHLGHNPLAAAIDEKRLMQGSARKGTLSKLNFLLVGSGRAREWCASQLAAGDPPPVQALWQTLTEAETRRRQAIQDTLSAIELAVHEPRSRRRL